MSTIEEINKEYDIFDKLQLYKKKKIPYSFNTNKINLNLGFIERRQEIIKHVGYSLLTWEWINKLEDFLKYKNVLEVCAGCGSLSWALKYKKRVNIITTDLYKWNNFNFYDKDFFWANVEKIEAVEAVKKYGKDIDYIIASWFPYDTDLGYKCLLEMRKKNKHCKMIVISEGLGGCVADNKFFETIEEIEDDNIDNINKVYPTWVYIHDYIMLCK